MKEGLYKVETIEEGMALLAPTEGEGEQFTFEVQKFAHDVAEGDVVEFWQENTEWKTKYREDKTGSMKSHTKDFIERLLDKE